LAVPRLGKFDGVGHAGESVANVEAFDAAPLAIDKLASKNTNHRVAQRFLTT
jgi:hypothetical protein